MGEWVRDRGDEIALVDIVALEYLMGARSASDYTAIEEALSGFRRLRVEVQDWERARVVDRSLAERGAGLQRSVRVPYSLIAAVAERNGLPVAHYDEDYERIATITGQATRWVLPRGTA